ncbi:helix-turn-helix domain-containing protein [Yokenella regensburgei]|uniref:helix-turn-helix domain-containing protein n=1 Tax=Yokenella regensburgei TaxID=158877 RepID=UPI003ED934EB
MMLTIDPMRTKKPDAESLITQRLNEIIESKKITKADMARIADVSPQSVNGWFKRGSISKDAAAKISAAVGISIAWILGEEDKPQDLLSSEEKRLIETFRQFPPVERSNMLLAFEMRLQELQNYYSRYVNPDNKK